MNTRRYLQALAFTAMGTGANAAEPLPELHELESDDVRFRAQATDYGDRLPHIDSAGHGCARGDGESRVEYIDIKGDVNFSTFLAGFGNDAIEFELRAFDDKGVPLARIGEADWSLNGLAGCGGDEKSAPYSALRLVSCVDHSSLPVFWSRAMKRPSSEPM